ncbi:MAG TPA: ubiquinone/menaquinone biosynthesis methyltransferase [Deltaproteobacteria bacterium]|nr:ubiquinone/menaquinone biosynthesis methyltransferase [Deltaproteobacteria bacterium]
MKSWNQGVREMFGEISPRYDLMNTLMTFGMDRRWRRIVTRMMELPPGGLLLDIGAGTGEIAIQTLRRDPRAQIIAADLTHAMMKKGVNKTGRRVAWCGADALVLPFRDNTFDSVTAGFLVRNVPDIAAAFREQLRVLKPGGTAVCLDTSPPADTPFRGLIRNYFRVIIPCMGTLIAGNTAAYRYLPQTTNAFKTPLEIAGIMSLAGFHRVVARSFMFGTIGIVSGKKPL